MARTYRPSRAIPITIVLVAALGACSYSQSDSLSPVRSLGPTPTRPVVQPYTTPPTTPPPPTTAVPSTEAPTTTVVATAAPTAAPPPTTPPPTTASPTTSPPARSQSSVARSPATVSVQAGAFRSRESAELAAEQLADRGFGGFRASGTDIVRVLRPGLGRAEAEDLVERLASAGIPALVTTIQG